MFNISICDDEQTEINYLTGLIHKWAGLRDISVRVLSYMNAEAFLFAYGDDKKTDILLLDIQMGGMDGVTLAKKIRAVNKEIQIAFITGHMDYISDGYDVEALHYLLKPVTEEKLFSILDRAAKKLSRFDKALFISHAGETARIPLYEIRFFEVRKNYVTVYINQKVEYTVKKTLNEMEKELDGSFFRVGRSYIVNLRHIRKITKNEIHLTDGIIIPLPRGLYGAINRAVIENL